LISLVLQVFLWSTGRSALADTEIARFLLHPVGLVGLILVFSGWVCIAGLKLAVLVMLSLGTEIGMRPSLLSILSHVRWRGFDVLQLSFYAVMQILLVALPFAVCGGLTYWWLLTERDINYYLSDRPAEFYAALVVGGLLAVAFTVAVVMMLCRWVYALPLLLFEDAPPEKCLSLSTARGRRELRSIAAVLGGWALGMLLLQVAVTALMLAVADGLLWLAPGGLAGLVIFAGIALLLTLIGNTALSVLASISFAALISMLYVRDRQPRRVAIPALRERVPFAPRWSLDPPGTIGSIGLGLCVAALFGAWTLWSIDFEDLKHVEITAHRGGAAVAPENTLAAIEQAIEAGADWVEIDVQETRDGVVVVVHDSDLSRVAGNPIKIWEATAAELRQIDIGSRFDPRFSDQRVPKLTEVLELCEDRVKVNIELKYYGHEQQLEQRVFEIVREKKMNSQVVVMSLKYQGLTKMHEILQQRLQDPRRRFPLGLLTATKIGDLTKFDHIDFHAVHSSLATAAFVDYAHSPAVNRSVHAWTLNDSQLISLMISRGVDNLITDRPALARRVLEEIEAMSSPERFLLEVSHRLGLGVDPPPPPAAAATDRATGPPQTDAPATAGLPEPGPN
jgi:glycerophosphoryl diester phosphodiesterase